MRGYISFVTLIATAAAAYWYSYRFEQRRFALADTQSADEVETVPATENSQTATAQPYKEHLVQGGETLYSISKQYGLIWSTVADYNQLNESSTIKPGMTIRIPINEKGEVTRIDHLAKPDVPGSDSWYNDPVAVVRKTAPNEYHLKNDDSYSVNSLDYTTGTAMIEVVHDGRLIVVSLLQYTPGKGNGWYITQLETR